MSTIAQNELLAKLPRAQLERAIEQVVEPVSKRLPDKRLKQIVSLAVRGISAAQSPIITQMARARPRRKPGSVGDEQTDLRLFSSYPLQC